MEEEIKGTPKKTVHFSDNVSVDKQAILAQQARDLIHNGLVREKPEGIVRKVVSKLRGVGKSGGYDVTR